MQRATVGGGILLLSEDDAIAGGPTRSSTVRRANGCQAVRSPALHLWLRQADYSEKRRAPMSCRGSSTLVTTPTRGEF